MNHHAIFVNGIQAAGKTTVARKIRNREPRRFRLVESDEIVRRVPPALRVDSADMIWSRVLDSVEESLEEANVLVDAALTADQVVEARDRFGASAAFVILRIDEDTRSRRQADRNRWGNRLAHEWRPEWHDLPGEDDLYDLVCDAASLTASQCASRILAFEADHWPEQPA